MRRALGVFGLVLILLAVGLAAWGVPAPPSYTVEDMPRIGWRHAWRSFGIVRAFAAERRFAGWYGHEARMFVAAGATNRFLRVDGPGQVSIEEKGIPERAFGMHWSRDVERPWVTFALDEGGSERYRFFRYDLRDGVSVELTKRPARAYAAGVDPAGRRLAFTSTARNGRDSDVYVVDVAAPGAPRLVFAGGGDLWLSGWTNDGRLLVHRHVGIERSESFLLDPDTGAAVPLFSQLADGVVVRRAVRARRGATTYLAADLGGEFIGLHALDPATGETTALAPQLARDVVDIATLADEETLLLIVNDDAMQRLFRFDLRSRVIEPVTAGWPGGFPVRIAAHPTLPLVAVDIVSDAGVTGVWTYDASDGTFEAWSVEPGPARAPPPEVVRYPTFDVGADGRPRTISAVLLRPSEPLAHPQPVLIDIHGGPTAQSLARVLPQDALRGPRPVIIRPNVRGSTGYGSTFAGLDDGLRREDAVRDIGALLDWIVTQPDLDASRVAVMGASYGGFMALASLARYGDRLRCGVDMFGITDLPTFIEQSEQGHFADAQRGEYGDPTEPAARAYLRSISPITQADRIRRPLFVYQGANDIRVKPSQSRLLVDRVRAAGGEAVYLEVPGEGHGLRAPMAQFYFGVAMIEFLTRCIGER